MKWIRKHRPSPGTAFGATALMIALGGVAFAAIPDSTGTIHGCYQKHRGSLRVIDSDREDCRASEKAISWNQQGPPGSPGQLVAYDEAVSEVSTTSDTYVDLGGPSVTVDVPASGLIAVLARTELRGAGCQDVALHESTDLDPPLAWISSCANQSYLRKWSSPAVVFSGAANRGQSTWTVLEATPGTHTYSLRYRTSPNDSDEAFFRNRKLWIKTGG